MLLSQVLTSENHRLRVQLAKLMYPDEATPHKGRSQSSSASSTSSPSSPSSPTANEQAGGEVTPVSASQKSDGDDYDDDHYHDDDDDDDDGYDDEEDGNSNEYVRPFDIVRCCSVCSYRRHHDGTRMHRPWHRDLPCCLLCCCPVVLVSTAMSMLSGRKTRKNKCVLDMMKRFLPSVRGVRQRRVCVALLAGVTLVEC